MTSIIKKISLFLIVIIIIGISVGCKPKEIIDNSEPPVEVVEKKEPEEPKDPVIEPVGIIIKATEKVDTAGYSIIDSYIIDINDDGEDEAVTMYVNAEVGADGEIHWDDGQNWIFVVEGLNEDYILFDDYLQLGTIRFHVYTVDEDNFYISSIKSSTASLTLTEYRFDKESNTFISNVKYETTGNVNMIHSSYGY